ncbi:MAG: VOC family protein [Eubacteriales bacterium]
MKIEHIAIWSKDIEKLKEFYTKYFGAKCSRKYINEKRKFQSYFLSFDEGARIEIMQLPDLKELEDIEASYLGLAHFALSVGSEQAVDEITHNMAQDGIKIVSQPRTTGDGYYESLVRDTEGNKVEITI